MCFRVFCRKLIKMRKNFPKNYMSKKESPSFFASNELILRGEFLKFYGIWTGASASTHLQKYRVSLFKNPSHILRQWSFRKK